MPFTYLVFNKPFDVLTQFTDEQGRKTLKDYIPVKEVYPVGRLDLDSEGLMLLTNDAKLQHRLAEPRFKVPKTYWAQVEGQPQPAQLIPFATGIMLGDRKTAPAKAQVIAEPAGLWQREKPIRIRQQIPTSWLEVTITEGMNRQVRRMTAAAGFPTLRLIRAAIGPLKLQDLAPGQWRPLTPEEVASLYALTSGRK